MLRASEMAVRQRSQMPLMVRQISLCPGLACPGLAALPSWGSDFKGRVRSVPGFSAAVHPMTIALWRRGRLGKR
jgi:hypothetical protein